MSQTEATTAGGKLVLSEQQALELLAYLTSAAELCLREPDYYGSLRLLDGASRLVGAMLEHEPERSRAFLEAFKRDVDEKKVWCMWDREAFYDFTRSTPATVAAELRRVERVGEEAS